MKSFLNMALVGDYDPKKTAHICAPQALTISAKSLGLEIEPIWLETSKLSRLSDVEILGFDGIWCVPGSPYMDRNAVLRVINLCRVSQKPYLGTCGGCQHAVLEYALNDLHISGAGIAEDEPDTTIPLISALQCRLTDEKQEITLESDSRLGRIYGIPVITEEYRCGFGINPKYIQLFENSDLTFSAFSESRVPQAIEIERHPFFIGTAFQPERSARQGLAHPLITEFLKAAMQ